MILQWKFDPYALPAILVEHYRENENRELLNDSNSIVKSQKMKIVEALSCKLCNGTHVDAIAFDLNHDAAIFYDIPEYLENPVERS